MDDINKYTMEFMTLDIQHLNGNISNEEYWKKREEFINSWQGNFYEFRNEDDIINMIELLTSEAKDVDIFPVVSVYNPKRMIQLGLYPASLKLNQPWIVDWLTGLDDDSTMFWSNLVSDFNIQLLNKELLWKYKTLKTLKEEAIENANSITLISSAPELIYNVSKRPKTDMSLFRNSLSHTASRRHIIDNKITIAGDSWNVIPVTRYAKGMSKGLYFSEDLPQDSCGTFYYYEPESTTLLAYKTKMSAFNKTDAMKKLGILDLTDSNIYDIAYEMDKHINGYYPKDLILTPSNAAYLYRWRHGYEEDLYYDINPNSIPQTPHYAGNYLDLYAEEDKFDQPLCKAANNNNFDIVILENMVGSFQIVTEILDTRSREDSFKSLIYLID